MPMFNNSYTSAPNMYYPSTVPMWTASYGQPQMPYIQSPMPQQQNPAQQQQQANQKLQQSVKMGRIVSNPSEISAQDVSMDGSLTLFPDMNGQVIYGRMWQPNGNISEVRFVPDQVQSQSDQNPNDPFAMIMDQLSDIKDEMGDIKNAMDKRQKTYYNKKVHRNDQNGSVSSEGGGKDA